MPTFYRNRGFVPGYIGSPPAAPAPVHQPAQSAADRMAYTQAIEERNRRLEDQKAEMESAKLKQQAEIARMNHDAAMALTQTRTNAAWNEMLAKAAKADKPKNIKVTTKDKNGEVSTTREFSPAEFDANERAKNAPEIAKLTAERSDMTKNIQGGDNRYGLFNLYSRPNRLAEIDAKLAGLNPPQDLVTGQGVGAPGAAVVSPPVAPTPQGFIGSPGANTFLPGPTPLGLNRAQTNAYAIDLNNGNHPVPSDLLRPRFSPTIGDLRLAENTNAPVAIQDAPMAPFAGDPGATNAVPAIPKTHIAHLLANPDTLGDFEKKYGVGSAAQYLDPVAEEP